MTRLLLVLSLPMFLLLGGNASAAQPEALKSTNVEWLGEIPAADGVSASFVGTAMYLSTFHGLEVYDITNAAAPVKVGELPLPLFQNEDVSTNGEILLISRDSILGLARLYVVDISDPAHPSILSTLDTNDFSAPGSSIGHTASCIDNCRYAWLTSYEGVDVVDLRDPRRPRFASPRSVRMPYAACDGPGRNARCDGTHDVQIDESGLAWVAGSGGTVAYDVSDPTRPIRRFRTNASGRSRALEGRDIPPDGSTYNDFIHHNSLRRGDTLLITEEDFRAGCVHPGSLQTWRIGSGGIVKPLDKFEVERDPARSTYCSAHYFDEREGLLAQGWYEAGARFIDWTDPKNLRQTGYWIPRRGNVTNVYWAPTDPAGEIVYAFDEQRAIDILRIDRAAPAVTKRPPRQGKRSGIAARPDVRALIESERPVAKPGTTMRYAVYFENARKRKTRAGSAVVELGKGLSFARGEAKVRHLQVPRLENKEFSRKFFNVRVSRNAPRFVEASVVLELLDGDPANDFAVYRNATRKRDAAGARASAARPLFCMIGA